MNGHVAENVVRKLDGNEIRSADTPGQGMRGQKSLRGTFEVAVGFAISAEQPAEKGYDTAHVESDHPADDISARWCRLQTGDAPSGFQNSVLLFQRPVDIDNVAEHEAGHNRIEDGAGKGKLFDIGDDPANGGVPVSFMCETDHLGCDVYADDSRSRRAAKNLECEFSSSGSQIENPAVFVEE